MVSVLIDAKDYKKTVGVMSGTQDIKELLAGMTPTLDAKEDYIFLTVSAELLPCEGVASYLGSVLLAPAVGFFHEEEGLTAVLPESYLDNQMVLGDNSVIPECIRREWAPILLQKPLPRMKRITMKIHSSLTAVGFTAAFSKVLTEAGISCNVVAGFFHDHIFVPSERASAAMTTLTSLSADHNSET